MYWDQESWYTHILALDIERKTLLSCERDVCEYNAFSMMLLIVFWGPQVSLSTIVDFSIWRNVENVLLWSSCMVLVILIRVHNIIGGYIKLRFQALGALVEMVMYHARFCFCKGQDCWTSHASWKSTGNCESIFHVEVLVTYSPKLCSIFSWYYLTVEVVVSTSWYFH